MDRDEAQQLLERGPDGVQEWNRRRAAGEAIPSLREVDLYRGDLAGVNFQGARLLGGCLAEANLTDADCSGAILYEACLQSVKARGARFVGADLRHADFGVFCIGLGYEWTTTDLTSADFSDARMRHAKLTECTVDGARFCRADMREAVLWDTDFSRADLAEAMLDGAIWDAPRSPEPPAPINFGQWLREQRQSRGLTPEQLAARIGCGLCAYDVTNILEKKPDGALPDLARRLADALGIAVSDVPMRRSRNWGAFPMPPTS